MKAEAPASRLSEEITGQNSNSSVEDELRAGSEKNSFFIAKFPCEILQAFLSRIKLGGE